MKELSKKEKLWKEKDKKLRNKKIINWSLIILFFLILGYLISNSAKTSVKFENPEVDLLNVPDNQIHWHPKLEILINGELTQISNNIGLTGASHSQTHTHNEGDGTIHLENLNPRQNPQTMSLGYFFNQWGKPFNETCILDKCLLTNSSSLKMFVNGERNYDFEKYIFKGEEKIKIEFTD